jgi:hypothetical protein
MTNPRFIVAIFLAVIALSGPGLMGCTVTVAPTPEASRQIMPAQEITGDAALFYDDLEPYGEWFRLENYGWVWAPYDVPADWRPYTSGRWTYTDYGWTWASDEEWGWAPFHYGRWLFDSRYGWVWVPGREWAPAWVAWRFGGGWVGWVALPPGAGLDAGVSLDRSYRPDHWCFIEDRLFLDTDLRGNIILPARNVTLIRITADVTNYAVAQNRIVNRSLSVEMVERMTRRKVTHFRVVESDSPRGLRGPRTRGDEFIVYRPEKAERKERRRIEVRHPGPASGDRSRGAPSQEILRRQDEDRRSFERGQEKKRAVLREEHKKESGRPPAGVSREELRRRHEAEQKALDDQLKTEKQILDRRHEREQSGEIRSGDRKQKTD